MPERQIVADISRQRMMTLRQGMHTVEGQPCGATPNDYVAMHQWHTPWAVASGLAAPKEDRGKAQRDRNDRAAKITFVSVLV